ncbi:MAG: hypothetical protein IKC45_06930 [Clostridia bacterium]|nr:hypothetical protein [Clostridia bacterium]
MKLLKSKKFLIVLAVLLVIVTGYRIFGGSESKLEKQLIATLPIEITNYYWCPDGYELFSWNESNVEETLDIKEFTIDRQTTDGNFKTADCTIVMENERLVKTVCVNLTCIRYDDGSWQVEGWSYLQEPKTVPKEVPDNGEAIAIKHLTEEFGFNNLKKNRETVDLENGEIVYYYQVNDQYKYVDFTGEVKCTVEFGGFDGIDGDGIYCYSWECDSDSAENNTKANWNIFGIWHFEKYNEDEVLIRYTDVMVNQISEEDAGTVKKYEHKREKVGMDGPFNVYDYTGNFECYTTSISCTIEGNNPLDAKCIINPDGLMNNIVFTRDSIEEEYVDWTSVTRINV